VPDPVRVLLVSGSLREQSTSSSALRTVQWLAPTEIVATVYGGMAALPHFNPDDVDPLPPAVAALRDQIRNADALLFSTPEYAGALPGAFKNLLDWTIGDDRAGSIYEKPVAWINVSPRGAVAAHESLRNVLGYAHALVVDDACSQIPVTSAMVGEDGLITLPEVRDLLTGSASALAAHVGGERLRHAAEAHRRAHRSSGSSASPSDAPTRVRS
jgi:NAD(P)H-dependent FMN reductase